MGHPEGKVRKETFIEEPQRETRDKSTRLTFLGWKIVLLCCTGLLQTLLVKGLHLLFDGVVVTHFGNWLWRRGQGSEKVCLKV